MSSRCKYFHSFDGDQIGRRLKLLILENRLDEIVALSRTVATAVAELAVHLERLGCTVLFAAGDSVLACSERPIDLASVPRKFGQVFFSGGTGSTPREALIALEQAKIDGHGELVAYRETQK